MTNKEKPARFSDLWDNLTDGASFQKLVNCRQLVRGAYSRAVRGVFLAGIVLLLGALAIWGVVWLGDFISPPEDPRDWDNFGLTLVALFYGLWAGIALGVISCADGIRNYFNRRVEDAINAEIEKRQTIEVVKAGGQNDE